MIDRGARAWLCEGSKARKAGRPKIVVIGGDDIGPEVTGAAVRCLRTLEVPVEILEPAHGEETYKRTGTAFPPEAKEALLSADAILYGACSSRSREILRFIRFGLETYANLRPARCLPGVTAVTGAGKTDLVIVRELTQGLYPGAEGSLGDFKARWPEFTNALGQPIPGEGAFCLGITTEAATRRVADYAVALAKHRASLGGRGHVTIVTKSNVLSKTDGMFHELCEQAVAAAGLEHDHVYVDEAARRAVACPWTFDVIVTTNLYGDILSDVTAEVMGGMPMAPSAGIGNAVAYFEPCHGGAPDIAGMGKANPTGALLSTCMMLSYLGFEEASDRLFEAIHSTLEAGHHTADLGGASSTSAFTDRVCQRL